MFVDKIKISAQAGRGGDGCVSFHRAKFKPKGGPDGGDGGKGGDIILVVDEQVDSLRDFFFKPEIKAENGAKGSSARRSGRGGKSLKLRVPPGTVIKKVSESGEDEFVTDMVKSGDEFILVKGGRGGYGNDHYKSPTNRAPIEFQTGGEGDVGEFTLELRKIADVGLVGFPNAGKSTLLRAISSAKPRVANYPFTTLAPHIGVVELGRYRRALVADIPGLIEGAHENHGLGHEFLRHIMRCQILFFVVDTAGSEGREPWDDIATLRREVSLYSDELAQRAWVIVANKSDLPEAGEKVDIVRQTFNRVEIFSTSAETGDGLDALKKYIDEKVGRQPD